MRIEVNIGDRYKDTVRGIELKIIGLYTAEGKAMVQLIKNNEPVEQKKMYCCYIEDLIENGLWKKVNEWE